MTPSGGLKLGIKKWEFIYSEIYFFPSSSADLIFSWIFNEYPTFVKQDTRRFISQETGNLYIAKVEPSDVGNYTCVVTNTVTKTQVQGPPTPLVLRSDGEPWFWTRLMQTLTTATHETAGYLFGSTGLNITLFLSYNLLNRLPCHRAINFSAHAASYLYWVALIKFMVFQMISLFHMWILQYIYLICICMQPILQ